jgi:O-6-methylguanine DNA methyltransferase
MVDKRRLVYSLVSTIPYGNVSTYGRIGNKLNIHPRQVGRILHLNTDPLNIPCHRVVNAKGEVASNYAFGGGEVQQQKLEAEGVVFRNNKVDLEECLWDC